MTETKRGRVFSVIWYDVSHMKDPMAARWMSGFRLYDRNPYHFFEDALKNLRTRHDPHYHDIFPLWEKLLVAQDSLNVVEMMDYQKNPDNPKEFLPDEERWGYGDPDRKESPEWLKRVPLVLNDLFCEQMELTSQFFIDWIKEGESK